ncbi:MAG: cytochrome ubiquinol oxidase subunit I [Verrucomicrobiota bacterium]|nr:cytochrome ubiquinol oxidase subunit I [Verrucomicrobiota bacterium]
MDVLLLSRIQFALNIAFHYLFPPISIGLGLMLVLMEGVYLKTRKEKYHQMTVFWTKIFALVFAMGVATGLVQAFAFGTNWARYSRFVGDVFGSALAAEGIFAFFLESGFLGVMLFGWNRVSAKLHYLSTICVSLGAHFSAVWILVAVSWMQTPAGFAIQEGPTGPRAVVTNFWEMVFNPSFLDRLFHTLIGCWLTGAFFVLSVGAYYLLKGRHLPMARSMVRLALFVAVITLLLQLISGDSSSRLVAKYQPSKLAACEGLYHTRPSTPISVIGWVDAEKEEVHSIKIPCALSLLTYRDTTTPVAGLDQVPRDEWPNVPVVFQAFHIMVLCWGLMFLIALGGLFFWWRNTLDSKRFFLWILVFSVLLPHIAQQAGWFTAELGRQPWIVWKILKTSQGVSSSIRASQVHGSIWMFSMIYLLLFSLFIFLLDRKIKHGPTPEMEEYRNPLEISR